MYEELIAYLVNKWRSRIPPKDLVVRNKSFSIHEFFQRPRKIVSIVGPRRTGKTYFVYQVYSEIKELGYDAVYLNFEDERIENDKVVLSDFLTVVKSQFGSKKIYLLLDEIQRIDEWSRWLRRVYDTENYNILVTGSTSKLIGLNLPREIGGRTITIMTYPLRFSEFIRFKGEKVDLSSARYSEDERAKLINLLEEYLHFGGLPEVVLSAKYKKLMILQEYYRTIMTRDIARGEIRNTELLDKFLKLIIRAKQMSISKIYNTIKSAGYKAGKGTLIEYLDRAKEAFFIETIPIHYESLKAKIRMPKKVYVCDNGYIEAVTPKVDMGRLLENAVYIELKRRYWHDPKIEIAYWYDGQNEVDFVVKKGNQILELIQVCYDISNLETKEREVRSLRKAMRQLGTREAIIVTGYQYGEVSKDTTKIKILPYWEWEQKIQPPYCIW